MVEPTEAKFDDITVGQKVKFNQIISESMVEEFSKLSGDYNPHHMDESYAKGTRFKKRICHGMLLASLYSQSLNFISPVFINDNVTVEGEVTKKSRSTGLITIKTKITNKKNIEVITGIAKVLVLEHDLNNE